MKEPQAGFREMEHTADWQLEVWGPDLPALLEQAARGMYALSGARLAEGPRQSRRFRVEAQDAEELLVYFLGELLFLGEQAGLAFDTFSLEMEQPALLQVEVEGAPLASLDKEIKAVTYHNLKVAQDSRGLRATLVFDV